MLVDAHGQTFTIGESVTVLSVDSCLSGLPEEDQTRLRAIVGQIRKVVEFDPSGFVWLCFTNVIDHGGDFCLLPNELVVVKSE